MRRATIASVDSTSRLATLSLVSILLLSVGCGLWLGITVQRASANAQLHLRRADSFQGVRDTLATDTTSWDASWSHHAIPAQRQVTRPAATVIGALQELLRLGTPTDDPDDRSAVAPLVRAEQSRFHHAMEQLAAALAHRDVTRAAAIHEGVIVPLLTSIDRAVAAAARQERAESLVSLRDLDRVQSLARLVGSLSVLGVVLTTFWSMRLRADAAVRASDARKSAIMAAALDAIITMDHEGRIVEFNPAAERMFGYSHQDALGRELAGLLIPPALRERHRQGLARYLASGHGTVLGRRLEMTAMRADGAEFPIEIGITRLPSRGPALFSAFVRDISARKQAAEALRQSEERYRRIVETAREGIWQVDAGDRTTFVNQTLADLLGYTVEEMMDQPLYRFIAEDIDLQAYARDGMARRRRGESGQGEIVCRRKDGSALWVHLSASSLIGDDGRYVGALAMVTDISARKEAEESLRAHDTLLRTIYTTVACGIVVQDAEGAILYGNEAAERILGLTLDQMSGRTSLDPRWRALREDGSAFPGEEHPAMIALRTGQEQREVMMGVALPDGERRWIQIDAVPVLNEAGVAQQVVCSFTDVSERKHMMEALRHQALHDALTGLPNRTLLSDRLDQAVRAMQRDHAPLALLVLDLDRFKEVNDTFGHHHGDLLLRQVAERLHRVLRASDTVARLGGDEFALLLSSTDCVGAVTCAETLCRALDAPFIVDGHQVQIGGSIGIALCPEHGTDAQTLLRRADVAMYVAKRADAGYTVYAPQQDEHMPDRLALITDLRQAIARDELRLYYQPQVNLGSGRVCGVEALARWPHPVRGLIPPDQFIPLAEQMGLIAPLTRWVLEAALRDCQQCHIPGLDVPIAVNLSAANLRDPQLPDTVAALLQSYDVPPWRLRLEVTESTLMVDPERAEDVLARLAALGVGISIDDFGTGYSSLAHLKRLPVDEIKIDKSFVLHMGENETDATIVAATIGLAHNLSLHVVAEGVEDQVTWEALARMGCDSVQGYYLSRPLPAEELAQWLCTAEWAA